MQEMNRKRWKWVNVKEIAVVIPTKPTFGLPNGERGMWGDEGYGALDGGCWRRVTDKGD